MKTTEYIMKNVLFILQFVHDIIHRRRHIMKVQHITKKYTIDYINSTDNI